LARSVSRVTVALSIVSSAEMKLLRPLGGYTLYDHKTNDSIRRELQTDCVLDKIDEYRRNWLLHPCNIGYRNFRRTDYVAKLAFPSL